MRASVVYTLQQVSPCSVGTADVARAVFRPPDPAVTCILLLLCRACFASRGCRDVYAADFSRCFFVLLVSILQVGSTAEMCICWCRKRSVGGSRCSSAARWVTLLLCTKTETDECVHDQTCFIMLFESCRVADMGYYALIGAAFLCGQTKS